jgi:ubiquinone biosynthesis protein
VLGIEKKFDIDAFLIEIREMLTRELDLRTEAINIRRFENNFKNVKKYYRAENLSGLLF